MKIIELSKDGAIKVFKGTKELYPRDLVDSVKSCVPGEWVYLKNTRKSKHFLAFVNPLSINSPIAHIVEEREIDSKTDKEIFFSLLERSIKKRSLYKSYEDCARLVYGNSDALPGLIIDSYCNAIIAQINTAGIDRFRNEIKSYLKERFIDKEIVLLDNEKYRERESLPIYDKDELQVDLKIIENDLNLKVLKNSVQKVGYYYDHRENRRRAFNLIGLINKEFNKGLDLFSYVGSWGMHFLKAGVSHVDFVDQGDMEKSILENLSLNDFDGKGEFIRQNVFDFLKEVQGQGKTYDIICSDPPAFCKSKKEERKAYEGYLKLHKTIFDILEVNSILIACSCTYYINPDSFQKNIEEAAFSKNRKIQLIDCGVQGFDHPTTSLNNKNTYLKYFAYAVE